MYEESIRVPLIIRDPRHKAGRSGRRVEQVGLNIDLAPTMLDYAGLPIPDTMQGKSLAPIVAGADKPLRDDWYYEHFYEHRNNIRPTEGVRTKEWKYVRFPKQTPVYEQLFHLTKDPYEQKNLAQDPSQKQALSRLRQRCNTYRRKLL